VAKGAEVLPTFLVTRLPAGVAGLLLAAIFAASMSSLDSAIHSMSTATIVDFLRRFSPQKPSPRAELLTARFTTVACGVLATIGAWIATRGEAGLLETLVTWLGYFAGPLLGLFLLGMLTRRANEAGALLGVAAGSAVVLTAVLKDFPGTYHFHPLWLAPLTCLVTGFGGWAASLPFAAPASEETGGAVSQAD
jgi:SSS family solute:Na+ symporter